ncbi:Smr/MutS family protein [Castellaniella hirudinis]|uniref:Smr/MutS family protein n=1 Tax=Castellaniella hirudinis TaxID=1144617 RepID=UPI0039C06C27
MKDTKPGLADLRRLRSAPVQAAAKAQAAARQAAAQEATAARRAKAHRKLMAAPAPATRPATPPDPDDAAQVASSLAPADRALFRQAMRLVQPLPDRGPRARASGPRDPDAVLQTRRLHAQGEADPPPPAIRPPRQRARPPQQAFDPEARQFLQPGCGPDLLRGLQRGKWVAQATLDLHGSTLEQAYGRLERFLNSCLENDIRCIRIVHGKGFGSHQGQSVLKTPIRQHLCRLAAIQAWAECGERDGGAGAVVALLRLPPTP